ncbi:hypothetical protein EAH68_11335 [Corynebacterium hylobatis]|uniref:Uncharacterized protein n=1 Tax=Corynebacterium hylobatis TaxID=1859290 RepID=A0A3S0C038_9CORY|nr:hypothetical protein [Corynebacterium hylobatis]RSZ61850.1 hypothetical protein EAH68_11335 [Corynebacterium hylobatis]
MVRPLRRTRGDLIATGAIAAVSLMAVAGVWATAPIRGSELTPAATEYVAAPALSTIPDSLTQVWALADTPLPGVHRPVIVDGLVVTHADRTVTASDPAGETVWTYRRDLDLCSLGAAWGRVVTTWRAPNGCGDVVALDADSGTYNATRSAVSPDEVVAVASNDRIGTAAGQRLELWRSDMVRTVEYGEVEGIQEPRLQPHPDCRITSALTRTDLLAVTEVCPDGQGTWLRFQDTTPEQARAPEISADVQLDHPEARLMAIGQEGAAVYQQNELISFTEGGQEVERRAVPQVPWADQDLPFAPVTADLPHHMSFFDGQRLYLLSPANLTVRHVLEDAVGTGVAVDGRLLMPTAEGIAVVNWDTGETEKTIPVDRGGHDGMVTLGVVGDTVVEKRGGLTVGLRQAW